MILHSSLVPIDYVPVVRCRQCKSDNVELISTLASGLEQWWCHDCQDDFTLANPDTEKELGYDD